MVSSRNKTISCTDIEKSSYSKQIKTVDSLLNDINECLYHGDFFDDEWKFPDEFADLIILDPPYNLTKNFHGNKFKKINSSSYMEYFRKMIVPLVRMLKPTGTIYACSDWFTSAIIYPVLSEHLYIRNRITWDRNKGRGNKNNYKNNMEDIWFCTKSNEYYFNVDAIKLRRKVLTPFKVNGVAQDWQEDEDGGKFRMTYPSNLWTDITIPFWSMVENTPHPTQKPEKLIARLILASSKENDMVFDPFLGSGTSVVVANKLNRNWCGLEQNIEYLYWTCKRLEMVGDDPSIQGYKNGVFIDKRQI